MFHRFISLFVLALAPAEIPTQEKKPAHVDQYGDALPPGALARLGTVRFRQPDFVRSLAVSPDGKRLASGGDDIHLWEMPSGRPLKRFPLYREKPDEPSGIESAPAVAFSAKGDLLALGNCYSDGAVLYDPVSGKKLKQFEKLYAGQLSADGTFARLGSVGRDSLWNMTTGKEVRELPHVESTGMALSADGKILAICEWAHIHRVDTDTGKDLPPLRYNHGLFSSPFGAAFSPDGKMLGVVMIRPPGIRITSQDVNSDIVLWETDSGKKLPTLKTYSRFVHPIAFSADGKLLAAALGDMTYGGGRTIVLLETATGKELDRPTGHEAAVRTVAFVADTNTVVSGCEHGTLRTWDASTGK
jgi:WD40 repeat protein